MSAELMEMKNSLRESFGTDDVDKISDMFLNFNEVLVGLHNRRQRKIEQQLQSTRAQLDVVHSSLGELSKQTGSDVQVEDLETVFLQLDSLVAQVEDLYEEKDRFLSKIGVPSLEQAHELLENMSEQLTDLYQRDERMYAQFKVRDMEELAHLIRELRARNELLEPGSGLSGA